MGVQIPPGSLVLSETEDGETRGEVRSFLLRLDLWPAWLEIGCAHAAGAADAAAQLRPDLEDEAKAALLTRELQQAVVAVTAFAFALDGFYDVVQQELGRHPHAASVWPKNRTARPTQVAETLQHHFKLGPTFTTNLRTLLQQLFEFRDRAVHPSSKFIPPNYRPEIDNAVHPHFITFSGPHAVHCRALVLTALDRLVARAVDLSSPSADRGWLDRGQEELGRLLTAYPVSGDEPIAFAEHMTPA